MSTETERVEYVFEGDASSLKSASESAMSYLKSYAAAVKDTLKTASEPLRLAISKSSVTDAQRSIQNIKTQYQDMLKVLRTEVQPPDTSKLKPVTEVLVQSYSAAVTKIKGLFSNLSRDTTSTLSKSQTALVAFSSTSQSVSAAFRRVADTSSEADGALIRSTASFNRATSAHKLLTGALQNLKNVFKTETAEIKTEEDALEGKNKTLADSTKKHRLLGVVLKGLGKLFSSETNNSKNFAGSLNLVNNAANLLSKALAAVGLADLSQFLREGIQSAIDYVENLNLFTVAMGKSVNQGLEFVAQMQEIYGLDPSNLYRYAGMFYQLTDAISMSEDASAHLSLSLTKASNDIASLFNMPIETVVQDMTSGLQGMSRAVRKYGMDIRVTTLQETARTYGLTEQVETMSEANRMALRYLTMMNQVKNATQQVTTTIDGATVATGDFARNIETPANQLRILKEQMSQLGRAVGTFIVAPLSKALAYINGFIMALRTALTYVAALFNLEVQSGSSLSALEEQDSAITGIGTSADSTTKKLKKMLAPFDELNILQDASTSGGAGGGGVGSDAALDPALAAAIADVDYQLENVRMKANDARDSILAFFGFQYDSSSLDNSLVWIPEQFESNLINKFPQWTATIQSTFASWGDIVESFKLLWEALISVLSSTLQNLQQDFRSVFSDEAVAAGISNLASNVSQLTLFLIENKDEIAAVASRAIELAAAFKALKVVNTVLKPIITLGNALGITGTGLLKVLGPIAAIAAVFALLYTNSEDLRNSVGAFGQTLSDLLPNLLEPLKNLLGSLKDSLSTLWSEGLQPLASSLGSLIADVLSTISDLMPYIIDIVEVAINLLVENIPAITRILTNVLNIIKPIIEIVKELWKDAIEPILTNVLRVLSDLWSSTLSPIITYIINIIDDLIAIITILWQNVLAPLVQFVLHQLGTAFSNVFNGIFNVVAPIIKAIGDILGGLIEAISGVTKFISGVFSGDWKKAWEGIKTIFKGIWDAFVGIVKAPINIIIGFINTLMQAFARGVNSILKKVNSLNFKVPDWVPGIGGENFGFNIKLLDESVAIKYLASGGVVRQPTLAMVGEGRYDEAVVPLGNSPQMHQLVQDIADAINGKPAGTSGPIHVHVYIGNEEIMDYIEDQQNFARLQRNGGIA